MFRFIGFLLGSAVSIGAILLLVGIPDFHWSAPDSDQARYESALARIRQQQPYTSSARLDEAVADDPASSAVEATAEPSLTVDVAPAASQVATVQASEQATPVETPSPDLHTLSQQGADELAATGDTVVTNTADEQLWQQLWSPFRSEIAARGFVARLEEVTGLDYRIDKIAAGVYQVGFAYENDSQKERHLEEIAAATGLDLQQP